MNYYIYRILILFISVIAYGGCAIQRIDRKMPIWTTSTVNEPGYYVGVGYAVKEKKKLTHYDLAHKMAINALASEISFEIMATTTLVSVATDKSVQDDLSSIVRTRATADINGYEKVDVYENKTGYWVYYRLSKQRYAQREAEKRSSAIEKAMMFFTDAQRAEAVWDIRTAVIQYAKALDAIKLYLDEKIEVNVNNENVSIISDSYQRIYYLLSHLKITSPETELFCKMGNAVSPTTLSATLTFNEKPIQKFPLQVIYSERSQAFKLVTDTYGIATFSMPIVKSEEKSETIVWSVDKNLLLTQSAVDYTIRKWLLATPSPEHTILLNIQKPSIYIAADERVYNIANAQTEVAACLQNLLLQKGYEVAHIPANADYILQIYTNTQQQGQINGVYTAAISGKIELKKANQTVFLKSVTNIKGTQLNYIDASKNAYKELIKQVEMRFFREMDEAIRK